MANKTYFDLCNEVLTELFYERVDTFEELDDITEGIKVKQDLNSALNMICNSENAPFKFRKCEFDLSLVEGVGKYEMPNGYIDYMRYRDTPIVLVYEEEHEYLPITYGMPLQYWIDNGKDISLYPVPDSTQTGRLIKVEFYTNDFARNKCGVLKPEMELADDEPIIPNHHRDILKWKVCSDWRGSLNDAKALFYERRYKKAYTNLIADQKLTRDYPAGFNIMGNNLKNYQNSIIRAFYLPSTAKRNY